jgi:hypothetical protein
MTLGESLPAHRHHADAAVGTGRASHVVRLEVPVSSFPGRADAGGNPRSPGRCTGAGRGGGEPIAGRGPTIGTASPCPAATARTWTTERPRTVSTPPRVSAGRRCSLPPTSGLACRFSVRVETAQESAFPGQSGCGASQGRRAPEHHGERSIAQRAQIAGAGRGCIVRRLAPKRPSGGRRGHRACNRGYLSTRETSARICSEQTKT